MNARDHIPEPAQDDPPWAWSAYFDDQIRLLREDGFKWPKSRPSSDAALASDCVVYEARW
jgi:hypothetical protein